MKKVVIAFCIGVAAMASQAEYLWWTVSNSDMGNTSDKTSTAAYLADLQEKGQIDYYGDVYANIVVLDSKGERVSGTGYKLTFTDEWEVGSDAVGVSMQDILGNNYGSRESYSYYVEIASSAKDMAGQVISKNTVAQTYADMNSYMTDDLAPAAAVWHGGSGSYKATPEPTSAMLMLLGVAGLALRRKQRKLA